jgi:hypothetical protein
MAALIEYRREVQNKCREVLERHLGELPDLGIEQESIKDYAFPELEKWAGTLAELGVKVKVQPPKGIACSDFYCALSWDSAAVPSPWFGAWVGMLGPKWLADALYKELAQAGTNELQQSPGAVCVGRKLEGEAASAFDEALEELLCQWIASWKKFGVFNGLKLT